MVIGIKVDYILKKLKKAIIVVLYKKGARAECKNHRPISLLSHVYKLFMTIIGNRITNDLIPVSPYLKLHINQAVEP